MKTKVFLLIAFGAITLSGFVIAALGGIAIGIALLIFGVSNFAGFLIIWAMQSDSGGKIDPHYFP